MEYEADSPAGCLLFKPWMDEAYRKDFFAKAKGKGKASSSPGPPNSTAVTNRTTSSLRPITLFSRTWR